MADTKQFPSPMTFACYYLVTCLVDRLMEKGLLAPEDMQAIGAKAAGANAAVELSEEPDGGNEAGLGIRTALEEAGRLAARWFHAGT